MNLHRIILPVTGIGGTRGRVEGGRGAAVSAIDVVPWGARPFHAQGTPGNLFAFVDEKTVFRG